MARMALGLVAVVVAFGAAPLAAAEQKIAVVDMQRALNECDAGKRAKDQVKAKFERSQNQLKKQREDLDRLKEDYERKATVLKDEERRNLEKDLESRGLEFKRKYEDFQRDRDRRDREAAQRLAPQGGVEAQLEQGVAVPSRTSPSEARAGGGRSRTLSSTACSRSSRGSVRSA